MSLPEAPTRTGLVDRTRTDHRDAETLVAVRFTPIVRLTKQEAFAACQALADADRALLQAGRSAEAPPPSATCSTCSRSDWWPVEPVTSTPAPGRSPPPVCYRRR